MLSSLCGLSLSDQLSFGECQPTPSAIRTQALTMKTVHRGQQQVRNMAVPLSFLLAIAKWPLTICQRASEWQVPSHLHALPHGYLTLESIPDKHDDKDKRPYRDRVVAGSDNKSNHSNRDTTNEFSLGTVHDKEAVAQKLQKAFGYSENEKLVEGKLWSKRKASVWAHVLLVLMAASSKVGLPPSSSHLFRVLVLDGSIGSFARIHVPDNQPHLLLRQSSIQPCKKTILTEYSSNMVNKKKSLNSNRFILVGRLGCCAKGRLLF